MDDARIVDLFLARDEAAITQSADKYGPRLRGVAYGIVRDRQTAEECENDTYLRAWDSIPPHEPRSYLFAFLAAIARHLALNRCRDGKRLKRSAYICELSAELEQCIPSPSDTECAIDDLAFGEAINGFLAELDEEKRNMFIRRYWYLDSVGAISVRFSISECKVKTTLFRCRKRLREYLEREGYAV